VSISTNKWLRAATLLSGLVFLILVVGCPSAPKHTVELAEIVDKQIAEMEASHETFVRLYYAKLREDVDQFMEQKWIPHFLANVVTAKRKGGKQFSVFFPIPRHI